MRQGFSACEEHAGVTFTWLGQDGMDDVSSRGHAEYGPEGTLAGHLSTISATNPDVQTIKRSCSRSLIRAGDGRVART